MPPVERLTDPFNSMWYNTTAVHTCIAMWLWWSAQLTLLVESFHP